MQIVDPFDCAYELPRNQDCMSEPSCFSNLLIQVFAFKLFMAFFASSLPLKKYTRVQYPFMVPGIPPCKGRESKLMEKVCRDTLEDIFDILV